MEKVLPKNWVETSIGQVLSLEYGKSLPSKKRSGEGYPVMGSNGVVGKHSEYLVEGPGIVVGRKGSHGEVKWVDENFFPIDTTYFVNVSDAIDLRFAFNLLSYVDLKSLNRSTAIPGLNRNDAYKIKIFLPPSPEQKRIVAKLDQLFDHLEVLKAKLERIPDLLADFRQSVLTQAVTGKLTEEWREGKELESVQKGLDKLYKERLIAASSKTESKKLKEIFQTEDEASFLIPENWKFVSLQKVCEKFTYGTSTKSDNDGTIPVIRMGNMQKGKIDWNNLKYTSDPKEIEKYNLSKGNVLFNRTNSPELVGKTSIYLGKQPAIYAGYLIKIWNFEELDSHFLNFALNSPYGRQWAWDVKTDGVSQSNINAKKLSKFCIPLPSPEEQKEIVRQVGSLFAKADAIEAQYQNFKEKIAHLPQTILAKAFRGELVEQLPGDGDATDLLKEIKRTNR